MPGSRNETRLYWASAGGHGQPRAGEPLPDTRQMTMPGPGESRFIMLTFPPGAGAPLHATPTLDYVVLVAGELWLIMEDGREQKLTAGDAIVQTGTRHAWENRSSQPCTIAATMIGLETGE